MKRRSFLLSAATLCVPVPARPAPFVIAPFVAKTITWPAGVLWTAPFTGPLDEFLRMSAFIDARAREVYGPSVVDHA